MNRTLILGGSKGLGKSIKELIGEKNVLSVSRSDEVSLDFSKKESSQKIERIINENSFDKIVYSAGGGPHGNYFDKKPDSHRWAYEVNFLRPIEVAYFLKGINYQGVFVYIGSAIAERSNSSMSLSYSLSKKSALKTLLAITEKELKVRVFSPPYMNTGLLPKNSWPRIETPQLVLEPHDVAKVLIDWLAETYNPIGDCDPRHFDWIKRFSYTLPIEKEL